MIQNPSKLSLFFSRLTNKINKKVKIAFALLLLVALGMFLYNAYQRAYKPYLYDKNNYYYKAYNYSVKKIIPQRKVVKDIEIEVLHFGKDDFLIICLHIRSAIMSIKELIPADFYCISLLLIRPKSLYHLDR